MASPTILCFAGSARRESFNKKLLKACIPALQESGATVTHIDLADYELPLYNADFHSESGIPKNALTLRELMIANQGFLIAAPEYNSSITPLLKNTIDWVSRDIPGEPPLSLTAFRGKTAGLIAASPGALGGLRGLFHVRDILQNIGVVVVPNMFALPQAHTAFDADGNLKDEASRGRAQSVARDLAQLTGLRNRESVPAR